MDKSLLSTYVNGNTIVQLYDDGTKIRYIPDNEDAFPVRPESIDLKITNRCNGNNGTLCPFCHECSTPDGDIASLTYNVLDGVRTGTELAIGGGNPLTHPQLDAFLISMKQRGVICNMTVHWRHFNANYDSLLDMCDAGLIHGLGVSVNEEVPLVVRNRMMHIPNLVVHTIAGVASGEVYKSLADRGLKLLILGYKTFGRGIAYRNDPDADIAPTFTWLNDNVLQLVHHFPVVSFDNLAIHQFDLRNRLPQDQWREFFMGDDGAFTMYIDLVKREFAKSSTSPRHPIGEMTIPEMFAAVRKERSKTSCKL